MHRLIRKSLLAVALSVVVACRHPTAPPPIDEPPVAPPSLTCPATVVADVQEAPALVEYPAPTLAGGTPPVTMACTIASGATFPMGDTDVICTATDAISRSAQCAFQVRVNVTARLKGTKFLAFGDSITEGEVSPPVPGMLFPLIDEVNNYPKVLAGLLVQRYPSQATEISVENAGEHGAQVTNQDEEQRLLDEITAFGPDVLLLLHGTNDTNGVAPSSFDTDVAKIRSSLDADVRRALDRGVQLLVLSTLLPQVKPRPGAYALPEAILAVNDAIREIAASRPRVVLLDSFALFNPQKEKLIGEDGLHPTIEGYKLLAEAFLGAIKANFEAPPAAAAQRFRR